MSVEIREPEMIRLVTYVHTREFESGQLTAEETKREFIWAIMEQAWDYAPKLPPGYVYLWSGLSSPEAHLDIIWYRIIARPIWALEEGRVDLT